MNIEDMLKDKIVEFLQCDYNWEKSGNTQKYQKLELCERKNLSIVENDVPYKYIECSTFKKHSKICVGIGFNPAEVSPNEIDNSNKKIISFLGNKEYGKFILLNLYPLVARSKKEFDEQDEKSIAFVQNCLPELLEIILTQTNVDVLIFWGRTVSVEQNIFEKIEKICEQGRLYMTVKVNENIHCHPAHIPIDIKKVEFKNLKLRYFIC